MESISNLCLRKLLKYLLNKVTLFYREKDRSVVDCLENMDFEKIDYNLVEQLLMHIACNMQVYI